MNSQQQTNKRQREIQVWAWVRRTAQLVSALIIFLAALLTVFYYLGWI